MAHITNNNIQVEVYMLQIFMSLIVGTTSGMWVTSVKTCLAWRYVFCCGRRNATTKTTVLMSTNAGSTVPVYTYTSSTNQLHQQRQPLMSSHVLGSTGSAHSGSAGRNYRLH